MSRNQTSAFFEYAGAIHLHSTYSDGSRPIPEIASIADVHAGAGLGSSSSFTVGLLNALYAYKGVLKSAEELAREACHLEIDILGEPIGKQDQYAAAYGGFHYFQFNPDGTVFAEPIIWPQSKRKELLQNLLQY